MNTRRTRMLIVFLAAAIVVSFFIQWDEVVKGAHDGFSASASHVESMQHG